MDEQPAMPLTSCFGAYGCSDRQVSRIVACKHYDVTRAPDLRSREEGPATAIANDDASSMAPGQPDLTVARVQLQDHDAVTRLEQPARHKLSGRAEADDNHMPARCHRDDEPLRVVSQQSHDRDDGGVHHSNRGEEACDIQLPGCPTAGDDAADGEQLQRGVERVSRA